MHLGIYAYTYMHVTALKKRGLEFEIEQRSIYGKVWRNEKRVGNDTILLLLYIIIFEMI